MKGNEKRGKKWKRNAEERSGKGIQGEERNKRE